MVCGEGGVWYLAGVGSRGREWMSENYMGYKTNNRQIIFQVKVNRTTPIFPTHSNL